MPAYVPGKLTLASKYTLGDPNYSNVSLLLHGDGANGSTVIVDSSPFARTINRFGSGVLISTFTSAFSGGSSIEFTGLSSDYLTLNPSNSLDIGTQDFTVECWVRLKTMPTGETYFTAKWIFGTGPTNALQGSQLYIGTTNLHFDLTADGSSEVNAAHGMTTGVWYHVAVTRSGSSFRGFVNGTQVGSTVTRTGSWVDGYGWGIGAAEAGSSLNANINAYIEELRVTKGIARYTADFAPPTAPFPDAQY